MQNTENNSGGNDMSRSVAEGGGVEISPPPSGSGSPTTTAPASPIQANANPTNNTASNPAPAPALASNDAAELAALRQRVKEIDASRDAVQERREAQDVVENFIRNEAAETGIPPELVRSLLPVTKDKAVLKTELNRVSEHLKTFLKDQAKRGLIKFVDVGGASNDGGTTPGSDESRRLADAHAMTNAKPSELIARGLKDRSR